LKNTPPSNKNYRFYTVEELVKAIKMLKNNKAGGLDCIPAKVPSPIF